jgi:hypothetical protein
LVGGGCVGGGGGGGGPAPETLHSEMHNFMNTVWNKEEFR